MLGVLRRLLLSLGIALTPFVAYAQSTPGLSYGQVPTAGQWNSYFAAKQDVLNYTPINGAAFNGYIFCQFTNGCSASTAIPTTVLSGILPPANFPALTGDVTTVEGSLAATLATVNANVGSFGGGSSIPSFTVNGKGLITAAGSNAVIAPAGTLTGPTLANGVTGSSLTGVSTLTSGATGAGFTINLGLSTVAGMLSVAEGGTGAGSFTSGLPLLGNGAGAIGQGTLSGNTTKFGTVNGTTPSNDCVKFDGSGNLADAGAACSVGTVSSGTTGHLPSYTASTTLGPSGIISTNGHLVATSATPALTSCGTSSGIAAGASDANGTITVGTGGTGCTVTFAVAYATTPDCIISAHSASSAPVLTYTPSTTNLVFTATSAAGNSYTYICMGQ